MCLPRRYFELNGDDLITIINELDENRCSVCGGQFKHTKRYVMVKENDGLKEVIFNTAHRGCLKIMGRIKAKHQEITDLEYKIYLKKLNPNSQT
jgi:tRNA U54 and U55 pseudouridine synthase Pus10